MTLEANRIKNHFLRIMVLQANNSKISEYEDILAKITDSMSKADRDYKEYIKNNLTQDKIRLIKYYIYELDKLFDDFKTIFDYIVLELWKQCVSKDFEKFNKFIYSRYSKMISEVNRIKKEYLYISKIIHPIN